MINPYTIGPMAVSGFTWYQGESNTGPPPKEEQYACLFPAMISAWRKHFNAPSAYFGFIQLSTWCPPYARDVARMRAAQMEALKLPKVGYATNADHGTACNIHPGPKQYCGARLGNSALALHYNKRIAWKSPSYVSASASISSTNVTTKVTVTINLVDVSKLGLTTDIYPSNYLGLATYGLNCTALNNKTSGTCAWAAIELSGTGWVNASMTSEGQKLLLDTTLPLAIDMDIASVLATSYGWGSIPLMNAYDKATMLPVLPWNQTL